MEVFFKEPYLTCFVCYNFTGCPVKKFVFSTQTIKTFFPFIFVAFLYKSWFVYHLDCFAIKLVSFWAWGLWYWKTREIHWRPEMNFLEDRYLEKWSFETSDFFSFTSSILLLRKVKNYQERKIIHLKVFNFQLISRAIFNNLNSNSIRCQTP